MFSLKFLKAGGFLLLLCYFIFTLCFGFLLLSNIQKEQTVIRLLTQQTTGGNKYMKMYKGKQPSFPFSVDQTCFQLVLSNFLQNVYQKHLATTNSPWKMKYTTSNCSLCFCESPLSLDIISVLETSNTPTNIQAFIFSTVLVNCTCSATPVTFSLFYWILPAWIFLSLYPPTRYKFTKFKQDVKTNRTDYNQKYLQRCREEFDYLTAMDGEVVTDPENTQYRRKENLTLDSLEYSYNLASISAYVVVIVKTNV